MSRCSICHTLVQPTDEVAACPECRQDYHRSCWDELGGCATYGCRRAVPALKPAPQPQQVGGWGDHKACPDCRRPLGASMLACACGARFPYADPMAPHEYRAWVREQQALKSSRGALIVLFILSLFGIPAPVLGPIAGFFAYSRRHLLAGAGGTYLAMGYGTAALGATYTLVIVLLFAGL
ncbi:MAG: RING finger protein [Planctomycetota bacterium]|jgi:hypothetical protein